MGYQSFHPGSCHKDFKGGVGLSSVACQATRSSGQTLVLADQRSPFPFLLLRHTLVHVVTSLGRQHASILLKRPCDEEHLPVHSGSLPAETQSPSRGAVQSQAYMSGVSVYMCIYRESRVCVCMCDLQDSSTCSNGDAVILCTSIFLEWVLLTPPLYDCTATGLVPVMLQRLELLVYFPSTDESKPHRSNNYKYTT